MPLLMPSGLAAIQQLLLYENSQIFVMDIYFLEAATWSWLSVMCGIFLYMTNHELKHLLVILCNTCCTAQCLLTAILLSVGQVFTCRRLL